MNSTVTLGVFIQLQIAMNLRTQALNEKLNSIRNASVFLALVGPYTPHKVITSYS
jgi:hypothetical protein